jgi:hypothetical protein
MFSIVLKDGGVNKDKLGRMKKETVMIYFEVMSYLE